MKAKLKNANGIVRFLLNHGEKLGIVAVLAVAGLLIYKSLGREMLAESNQPPALTARTTEAKSKVEQMNWDTFDPSERTDSSTFLARASDGLITPVPPEMGKPMPKFDPSIIDEMKLRDDPILVAVENVEVNAGSGLWMSADPAVIREKMIAAVKEAERKAQEAKVEAERLAAEADEGGRGGRRGRGEEGMTGRGGEDYGAMGGTKTKDGAIVVSPRGGAEMQGFEDIRERSWVTVLAKVPIKQQFQMYEDALVGAAGFNATNDSPEYLGYFVERAEVTEDGQGKWEPLTPVKGSGIVSVMNTWPIQTPDLVTPKYNHPLLTFPLPPMVMREWGDEITHSELPIQTPDEIMEEEMQAQEEAMRAQTEGEAEAEDVDNPFAKVIERRTQPMMGGEGGMYAGRGMGGEGGQFMGRQGMGGRGMGGEGGFGGEGRGMGGGMGGGMGVDRDFTYAWDGETKHLLFRYFDSTVTPGHRYRYRVRLAMIDVNAAQVPKFLAPEVSARLEKEKQASEKAKKAAKPLGWRLTEWSEPSPVAVVPQPGLIYLATAKPPSQNNLNAEPEARLVIKSLDATDAAEIALGDWFTRGSVLNRSQRAQVIWSSLIKVDPAEPIESPVFDFITGLTLVDFDGGGEMTPKNRKLPKPARALVMDSSGRLRLRNEFEDEMSVREYDLIMKASDEAARRQRERGGERRGGREGGRGE